MAYRTPGSPERTAAFSCATRTAARSQPRNSRRFPICSICPTRWRSGSTTCSAHASISWAPEGCGRQREPPPDPGPVGVSSYKGELEDDLPAPGGLRRAAARRLRRLRDAGRIPRLALARRGVGPRARGPVGGGHRVRRLGLPAHAPRKRVAGAGRTRGLSGRVRRALRDPPALPGGAYAPGPDGARHGGGGREPDRVRRARARGKPEALEMNGMTRGVIAVCLLLAGCGGQSGSSRAADTLTERQRDSMLAGSRIPGARGVGAALRAADSTSARIRATDSVAP